ncbi:uncharacterized protein METZ01_LOCUS497707, partial [marine metagenome]
VSISKESVGYSDPYQSVSSSLPYGTSPAIKTLKIPLFLHSYLPVKRPDSSVGR